MRIALYGGSFDPVHREHVRLVRAAIGALCLDRVLVVPSFLAPHKAEGAHASAEDRMEMCRAAFRDIPEVTVDDREIRAGGTSYTYLTCRALREEFPQDEIFLLLGADMLKDFFTWRQPDDIVSNVTVAACGRERALPKSLLSRFYSRFGREVAAVPFTGGRVSSTDLRVGLAFRGALNVRLSALPAPVRAVIEERGLYRREEARALLLERETRRAHSYRVALTACRRARGFGISEEKALLAAMLHDCAKYVPADSPMLEGFVPPEGVPEPVLHQYAGAYLAEHEFGVHDEEVLGAIRYHTSGKGDMTPLEKLIYLADLLEPARDFGGIKRLRALFKRDLDACMEACLFQQLLYLESAGKPVYPLTREAYLWYKHR